MLRRVQFHVHVPLPSCICVCAYAQLRWAWSPKRGAIGAARGSTVSLPLHKLQRAVLHRGQAKKTAFMSAHGEQWGGRSSKHRRMRRCGAHVCAWKAVGVANRPGTPSLGSSASSLCLDAIVVLGPGRRRCPGCRAMSIRRPLHANLRRSAWGDEEPVCAAMLRFFTRGGRRKISGILGRSRAHSSGEPSVRSRAPHHRVALRPSSASRFVVCF